jgi:hypothetical protein
VAASVAHSHVKIEASKTPQWTKPKLRDLVLVRSHALDKEHRRKLESRWLGLRLITNMPSEVSADVTNIYGDGKVKKYHFNDLKVYVPRAEQPDITRFLVNDAKLSDYNINLAELDIDPAAMKYTRAPGSRYIDLTNPFMF